MPNAAAKRLQAAEEALSPVAKTRPNQHTRRGGNQYTKRRDELTAWRQAERWQDNPRFSAAALMRRLADIQEGKADATTAQIKAIDLMLSRVAPTLSAVEQTTIDPSLALTESQIREQLRALIAQHPEILQELLAEQAKSVASAPQLAVQALPEQDATSQPIAK